MLSGPRVPVGAPLRVRRRFLLSLTGKQSDAVRGLKDGGSPQPNALHIKANCFLRLLMVSRRGAALRRRRDADCG